MTVDSQNIIENFYKALGQGDLDTISQLFSHDIEWTEMAGFPYGGVYIGMDAITANVFGKLGDEWIGFGVDVEEYVSLKNRVVAHGRYRGVNKASGKSIDVKMVHSWTVADGKITKFEQYTDTHLVQAAM
ncbi:MAG: nuclear transport factor 2 family protein [Litorimonas sp.]